MPKWVSKALYGKNTERRGPQRGAAVLGCNARGGTVGATGCTRWVKGLSGKHPEVEKIARNILDRQSA